MTVVATKSPLAFGKVPSDKLPNIITGKDEFTGWHWKDARCTWYNGLHSDENGMSRPDNFTGNLTTVRDALVASGKLVVEGMPSISPKWDAEHAPIVEAPNLPLEEAHSPSASLKEAGTIEAFPGA